MLNPTSTDAQYLDVLPTIEGAVGKDKLYAKVMVNATTTHDTVNEQLLDIMMRF